MADEYIKREDALTELDEIGFCDDEPIQTRNSALKIIQKIPAADVRPVVRGRWIKLDMHNGMEQHKCSVCNQECYVPTCMGEPLYSYCPNCGAKMEVQDAR